MNIYEIGVGFFSQCRTRHLLGTNHQCYLFEPNPYCYQDLSDVLQSQANFHLFNKAVGSEAKNIQLCLAGPSSFIKGVSSPEKSRNPSAENDLQSVNCNMLSIQDIDRGDIDVLLLDVEGGEFDIIANLKSRPKEICVEMYSFGVKYKNPYFDQIIAWMENNSYKIVDNVWNHTGQPVGEDYLFRLIQ